MMRQQSGFPASERPGMDEPLAKLFELIETRAWAYGEYRVAIATKLSPLASFGEGGEIAVASYFRRVLISRIKATHIARYSECSFSSCFVESKSIDFAAQGLSVSIVANGMDTYTFRLARDGQGALGLECTLSKGHARGDCFCAVC